METEKFNLPVGYLKSRISNYLSGYENELNEFQDWWLKEGIKISGVIDKAGTPWLKMFDVQGNRIDEICYPDSYWKMLRKGYNAGVVWRTFEKQSLIPFYLFGYVTAFFDPGLYCPYTVSISTAIPLSKYGEEKTIKKFLPYLLRKDESVWQGATWMTEIKGGSDLGKAVETIAIKSGDKWLLTGDKYFASNAGAELAVVAARPANAPKTVKGLALFLLPKIKEDGSLNYNVRRLKDKIGTRSVPTGEVELRESEAYLLGKAEEGVYLILELLNISRVANSIASVALMQRAIADAAKFAAKRVAFGKPVIEHPLLKEQFKNRSLQLDEAFALAWEAVTLLNKVWMEKPHYSDDYHLFRLVAHLAKYWTAEISVQTAKWAMEVYGGLGVLEEYNIERYLREAMILPIWEGTPHRQILDGLEVIEKKNAHVMLFNHLSEFKDKNEMDLIKGELDALLKLPTGKKESSSEDIFKKLAAFTATTLRKKFNN